MHNLCQCNTVLNLEKHFAGEIGAAVAAITAAAEATEVGAAAEEVVVAVTMMAEVEDTVDGKGEQV